MSTLADIRRHADQYPAPATVDDDTPDGHFLVAARVLGIVTTYLCVGAPNVGDAVIVGRIEWHDATTAWAYRGSGIKGGRLLTGWIDSAEAFAAMVTS